MGGGGGLGAGEHDAAVIAELEAGVVSDLPRMAVEVAERAGVSAVERLRRFASYLRTVRARLLDDLVHLLARPNVVREDDAAPACAVIRDAGVRGQLLAGPQHDDGAVRVEEGGLLDIERDRPPQCFVESFRACIVRDPERDEADPLLHAANRNGVRLVSARPGRGLHRSRSCRATLKAPPMRLCTSPDDCSWSR